MKKLPISGTGWVVVIFATLFLMFGLLHVVKSNRSQTSDPPLNTLQSDGDQVSLNTLDQDNPPPMPGGESTGFSPNAGGATQAAVTAGGGSGMGSSGTEPKLPGPDPAFDVPKDPVKDPNGPVAKEPPRLPVVWVTETDAKAYSQPGFNMPVVRPLKQWEELLIVESSKENWDRVQDIQGQQFWVQKKITTVIRPQNLSQPSIAEKKVMDFYTEVAHREHSDAYVHLSPEWKKELSFDEFVKGYARTDSLRSEIVNVVELGQDRYQVDVSMEALEEGDTVNYLGIYTVEKVDGKWYLTSGSLNKQDRR